MLQGGIKDAALFAAVSGDIGSNLQQVINQGVPMAQVFALAQPQLQALWQAQQQFGFAVDGTTQALLTQAEQQGFVGAQMKDVNQKILDVLISIADVFGAKIPDAMRGLPAVAQQAAAGMTSAFEGVKVPGFESAEPGGITGGGGSVDVPQLAKGGIVPARPGGTLVNVGEGGEAEAVVPLSKMGGISVVINGDVDSEERVVNLVTKFAEVIRLNRGGSFQRMNAALGNA